MNTSTQRNAVQQHNWISRFAFQCIRFMHDNFLIRRFRDPFEILKSMGIKPGDKVLEIGCGPGFFTLPAAQILGPQGRVVALDVNPFAVDYVTDKLAKRNIEKAKAVHANASDTGLSDDSIDLAFFIGVPHVSGGLGPVVKELRRVLRPTGRIAFHYGRWSPESLVSQMNGLGFELSETRGKVGVFVPAASKE